MVCCLFCLYVSYELRYSFRSKIVENLAVVNYDTNNLYLASYDWRLSYYNLEERDGYFSKLKSTIEGLKSVLLFSCLDILLHIRCYSDAVKRKRSLLQRILWELRWV